MDEEKYECDDGVCSFDFQRVSSGMIATPGFCSDGVQLYSVLAEDKQMSLAVYNKCRGRRELEFLLEFYHKLKENHSGGIINCLIRVLDVRCLSVESARRLLGRRDDYTTAHSSTASSGSNSITSEESSDENEAVHDEDDDDGD